MDWFERLDLQQYLKSFVQRVSEKKKHLNIFHYWESWENLTAMSSCNLAIIDNTVQPPRYVGTFTHAYISTGIQPAQ